MNFRTCLSALMLLLAVTAFSQTANTDLAITSGIKDLDKAFYQDNEEGIFFIDFDVVSVIVKSIVILDNQGNEKFKVEGTEAPIQGIFELNLKEIGLPSGHYILQVNSYTDSWTKNINI